ncbi:hypothetical protein [Aquimarina sp. 2201CG5-10]|uniref:hypothetical protein n=1 Tax=Aquimarina callyspongiae TaxID=3098150 RepID=UPI002AB3F18D|nr:hypothetical protein [Aquimarina sp. 2201CG5-10]MDY8138535.1 hypothetical protein [Aquimarina sp. 2201CG5-10]
MQITKLLSVLIFTSLVLVGCSNDDDADTIDPQQVANRQPLGSSANDLLSDNNFKGLTIEMISVQGFEPTTTAVNAFKNFLEDRLFKPDGITINQRSVTSSNRAPFTIEEISQIETDVRTTFNQGDEITVYIYFADGSNDGDTNTRVTLGSAYQNTSIVIYEGTLRNLSSRPNAPMLSTIEAATLNHEFAHLLGLVNIGTQLQSQHEDTESRGHCNVQSCLMEAAIEFGSGMMDMLGNGVPALDPLCIADLQANGGK